MTYGTVKKQLVEHFGGIHTCKACGSVTAYETLSDPKLKSTYDYRLNYNLTITETYSSKSNTTKTWSFDEKELKREQRVIIERDRHHLRFRRVG